MRVSLILIVLSALVSGCSRPASTRPLEAEAGQMAPQDIGPPCNRAVDRDCDGIDDRLEDPDGDHLVGCCLERCGQPGSSWQKEHCRLRSDGCAASQQCKAGRCEPRVSYGCSRGQSDPASGHTFGHGLADVDLPSFVCRQPQRPGAGGRVPVELYRSAAGDWTVALDRQMSYQALTVTGDPRRAAATLGVSQHEGVAGFVLSLPATRGVQLELAALFKDIVALPLLAGGAATVRASGTQYRSHDGYPAVHGTIVDLKLGTAADLSTARNAVLAAMLGSTPASLPGPSEGRHQRLVLRFTTVRRFAFARHPFTGALLTDSKGDPKDDGDPSRWRLVVIGGVASRSRYVDPAGPTSVLLDDLGGGSGLATAAHTLHGECDTSQWLRRPPATDVIWVVDDSPQMKQLREKVTAAGLQLRQRALASGHDLRQAVAGMDPAQQGRFCSPDVLGGSSGRFLKLHEGAALKACLQDPPGEAKGASLAAVRLAVLRHLRRTDNDPTRIRTRAMLVVIAATNATSAEVAAALPAGAQACPLSLAGQRALDPALQAIQQQFSGQADPQTAALFYLLGGGCPSSCGASPAHGLRRLAWRTGGASIDLCQPAPSYYLQSILDQNHGGCGPLLVFNQRVIAASLGFAINRRQLQRSRSAGFDYRGASNSLVLINQPLAYQDLMAGSYQRWMLNH